MKEVTKFIDNEGYPLSELAKNEWKEFALYSVEARAIPNMIDGLKPVSRFYLYSSIMNSSKEFRKVAAVAGVLSDYGYNHGESSAAGAGQLMAAEWNNNICLVEGRGSFGTRLAPSAAAPRYTYTKLHSNFSKYMKDVDLAPEHEDPEHEPPKFYVPVIPLVLANGVRGIATGFATNILPRDPIALAEACKEYIETKNIKDKIKIKFPHFNGKVEYDSVDDKFFCKGIFTRKSKTVLEISEVPYGYDRESYVKILDALEDNGEIVSYEDKCDKQGFFFEVKLKATTSKWDNDKIIKKFKLSKPMTENITVIGHDGKMKEYDDERQLIKDFCDFRLTILQQRIEQRIKEYTEEMRWLNVKMQFIQNVLDNKIIFKNRKKDDVGQQIYATTDADENTNDVDRLLRMNIMSLTDELVEELRNKIDEVKKSLKYWKSTTKEDQFSNDLEEIKQ